LETLIEFGNADECKQAQTALSAMGDSFPIEESFEPSRDGAEEPFTLLQCLQKQDSRMYEAHPICASSGSLSNHIVGCGLMEPPDNFLISSGKLIILEAIHNLHYL
jgi:hypothetical protein